MQVGDQAALSFLALELVKDQIPERIKDHAIAVALHRLRDVGMRSDHHTGARVNSRMGETDLLGVGLFLILDAGVHGDNNGIRARAQACDVGGHALRVQHCYAVVFTGVVAVGLVIGVSEKAVAVPIALDDHALVRLFGGVASACGGDAVFGEPVDCEGDAVTAAVARMIVGCGDYVDSRNLQGFDHLRLGSEYHALVNAMPAIGEGRFQIDEGDVGGRQQRREIAERRRRVGQAAGAGADIAGEHDVATAENARDGRVYRIRGVIRPAQFGKQTQRRRLKE